MDTQKTHDRDCKISANIKWRTSFFQSRLFWIRTLSLISKVDPDHVNIFCNSKLWIRQLVSSQPRAINEADFVVPGAISLAEGRRNYTDAQETSQWLGGTDLPFSILEDLLSRFLKDLWQNFVIC